MTDKEATLRHWEPYIYLMLIVVSAATTAILFYFVVHQQHQLFGQQRQIATVALETSAERRNSILRTCRDQNSRHGDAVKALDQLLKKSGVSGTRREQSRDSIVLLIDALAPRQNCQKLISSTAPKRRINTARKN